MTDLTELIKDAKSQCDCGCVNSAIDEMAARIAMLERDAARIRPGDEAWDRRADAHRIEQLTILNQNQAERLEQLEGGRAVFDIGEQT